MLKTLIFSDVHLEYKESIDPSYLTIRNVIAKEKFDQIIIAGDLFDFSYISRWTADSPGLTEGKRLHDDFELLESELKYMKKYCPNIIYLEGNHEERLQKFILANPVLEGLVSLESICSDNGVKYVKTVKQPMKIFTDLFVSHGLALNKYCAAQNVEKTGVSIITGHSHRTQSYTTSYLNKKAITGYSIGCISSLNPNWVAGKRISGWAQSFGILYGDSHMWDFSLIMVKKHKCIVGGKLYGPKGIISE